MEAPVRVIETEQVTPDTHVVRQMFGEGMAPEAHYVNSSVITGAEPVVVDCGPAITREEWMARTFEIVDPADVRWIYLSHDDVDHVGNLPQVLDLCPRATLVTTMFSVQRMTADALLPLDRVRLVNDGESWWAGDRELVAVRPPVYDSPTTRGLYDTASGVYWASDAFCAGVPHPVDDVAELDRDEFAESFLATHQLISPWHEWLDAGRYRAHLARLSGLGARYVTSAHGPTLRGGQVGWALDLLGRLPERPPMTDLAQSDLEQMLAALAIAA
ncbi:MAG TPA: MBL fold metallo-hydrolase [Acidimicrobiales bacterium]|nr:MBL fold metallo-hydrolase [Acidimicrobiales bacterium]